MLNRVRTLSYGILLGLFLLSGCDFFEVENPQEIETKELDDPLLMPALVKGAEVRFSSALTNMLLMGSLATDELIDTGSGGWTDIDHGVFRSDAFSVDATYTSGVTAIFSADDAAERIRSLLNTDKLSEANTQKLRSLLPWTLVMGGFARLYMTSCFTYTTIRSGPAQTPEETLEQAAELFTEAIEAAQEWGDRTNQVYALAGRARARLYLGDHQRAATDAQAALVLDSGFTRQIAYNAVDGWTYYNFLRSFNSMAIDKKYVSPSGLEPRVAVDSFSGDPLKYFTREAKMTLVKWQEMHLILAEAAWERGDLNLAIQHINIIRTKGQTFSLVDDEVKLIPFELSPFEINLLPGAPTPTNQVLDQLIYERAAEFWLEGLRWPDARRYLDPPFQHSTRSVWPPFEWVGTADPKQVFPIGITEMRHNPNL